MLKLPLYSKPFEPWESRLINLLVTGWLLLFLLLYAGGCASSPPTPTVIQSCKGVEQFLAATREPDSPDLVNEDLVTSKAALQGALAECNSDKKSVKSFIQQLQKGPQ